MNDASHDTESASKSTDGERMGRTKGYYDGIGFSQIVNSVDSI